MLLLFSGTGIQPRVDEGFILFGFEFLTVALQPTDILDTFSPPFAHLWEHRSTVSPTKCTQTSTAVWCTRPMLVDPVVVLYGHTRHFQWQKTTIKMDFCVWDPCLGTGFTEAV
jgi:hypothetical protein